MYARFVSALAELHDRFPERAGVIEELIKRECGVVSGELPSMAVTVDDLVLFVHDGKIAAIKNHRTRTGMGLKDSKDAIESAASRLNLSPPAYNY